MPSTVILKEIFGRTYNEEITGDATGKKVYLVTFDGAIEDMDEVVSTAVTGGLPALGSDYNPSGTSGLIAFRHTPIEIQKENAHYHIEIEYRTSRTFYSSPTARPWTISIRSLKEPNVPEQTLANAGAATGLPANVEPVNINEPIINKAEFPFDPEVVDLKTKVEINLRKNFSDITDLGTIASIQDLMDRVNTINDDVSITIAGVTGTPLQFLLDDASVTNVEANGELYYEVDLSIVYDPEYHVRKILNAGWMDANGNKIKGDRGGDISMPWPLDTNGNPIRGVGNRKANSIFLGFAVKRATTFADLGLPTSYGSSGDLPVT